MDGTGKTKVVIFESVASEIQKTNITPQNFINRRVKIDGKVTEYQGSLEVVLKDASSLKIVT